MGKNYLPFIFLFFLFFSCSTNESEILPPGPNILMEDILGKWDVIPGDEIDIFEKETEKAVSEGKQEERAIKIFSLVFMQNFKYQVVHSQGNNSGDYEILDAHTISLSGFGTLEEVQLAGNSMTANLILEGGIKISVSGIFNDYYKEGDCVSFLECYSGQLWLRRFQPNLEEDPTLVWLDYIRFHNDISDVWWEKGVLGAMRTCMVSYENNETENAEISILAHTSNLIIFRRESADKTFLYKYALNQESSWDYLDLQIVNLANSEVSNFRYNMRESGEISNFTDYSECQEERKTFVPDDVFEHRLIEMGLDDVPDNYVLTSQIEEVTELNLSVPLSSGGNIIKDITGIEDFVKLKSLNIENNAITQIDLSKLAELEMLNINKNQISRLDCSANRKLHSLKANENKITEVDVSNSPQLWNLSISNNMLATIDLSKNKELTDLMLSHNNFSALDLSSNTNLWDLTVNDNNLTTLDISNSSELWYLGTSNNNFTTIDLSGNVSLQFLIISNNNLTSIDLTALPALQEIYAENNGLNNLKLEEKSELYLIYMDNNALTKLDVSPLQNEYLDLRVRNNNLSCIQANSYQLEDSKSWKVDEGVVISLECN